MASHMLLVGNDPAARQFVEEAAAKHGFPCRVIGRGGALGADLVKNSNDRPALIILDLDMTDTDSLTLLRKVRQLGPAPIVVLSSTGLAHLGNQALQEGACDYLSKPLTAERVDVSMRNALKISVLEEEVARLKRQAEGKLAWSDIVAISPEMQRALSLAKRAADLDIPVLIEGERGTGRELFARAIHAESGHAGKPFIVIDCGEPGVPAQEKPAHALSEAKWADAAGGALFIKEIGELGPENQELVVQFMTRQRKGAPGSEEAKVRLIGSSSLDLIERVKNGQFREDLYYLINVFPIWIPPLRDRPDDLAHLVRHCLARFAAEEGKRIASIHPRALMLLRAYAWPGNVRQLENAIYRAVILADGDQLRVDDLPQIAAHVQGFSVPVPAAPPPRFREPYRGPAMIGSPLMVTVPSPHLPANAPLGIAALTEAGEIRSLTDIEADLIRLALGHYRGHITEVARRLGIGRSTLYRKMREFGLDLRHNSV